MPPEAIILAVLAALAVCAHAVIRECANAELHGSRDWWKKAMYRAQQRVEYREFAKQLEEKRQTSRSTT